MRRGSVGIALAALALVGGALAPASSDERESPLVRTTDELREAAGDAKPGTRIRIAAGTYSTGVQLAGLRGAEGKPIVLAADDAKHPPLFQGGATGLQLSDPAWVELENLSFAGQSGNGVNIDDGGTLETPAHHVVLRGITVRDVGPRGNHDGIKLSGLDDFRIEGCTVERWGTGGSAVDLVGCRRGTIEGCTFRHAPDATGASGVQAKGGTRDVVIRRNRFVDAGSRAVNAGGSTGLEYFRPALSTWSGPRFEAKDLVVEGNTFLGSDAPIAFVGVDGAVFRFNTVYLPGRWMLRILQENREKGFVASRGGEIADNVVVFRSDRWSEGGVNVGPDTEPTTFRFARNVWCCTDAPSRTRELVRLPVTESDGTYGKDPQFVDAPGGDLHVKHGSPARAAGADALPR